jgi:hypothetical protein
MAKVLMSSLFCLALFACAPAISVKDIKSIPPNEVLVFGELIATNIKDNKGLSIFIKEEGSQDEIRWPMKGDNLFYWHLKPGKYIITTFTRPIGTGIGGGRIWAKFEVPRDCEAVYVGTLKVTLGGISSVTIHDDMDRALEKLKERLSVTELPVKKNLIRKETF